MMAAIVGLQWVEEVTPHKVPAFLSVYLEFRDWEQILNFVGLAICGFKG